MAVWKVLVIGALGFACMGLGMATVVIGFGQEGARRWLWLGGLAAATLFAGALLALFLRYAGRSLDLSTRGSRH
jgi:hypothetical protein